MWLEEEDLERFQSVQCPVGILVGVEGGSRGDTATATTSSDLLVYGVLSSTGPPPGLLSAGEGVGDGGGGSQVVKQELRIYASPLSGSIIARAQALPTPPRSSDADVDADADTGIGAGDAQSHFAEFLPDLRSPSPKRKRVASLFESVAQHHKRVRQRGGEAVSQIMAPSQFSQQQQQQSQSQSQNVAKIKQEPEERLPALDRIASQRPRSVSIGSNLRPGSSATNRSHMRGLAASRKNTPTPFVEAAMKREYSPMASQPPPDGAAATPRDAETTIAENKNTITRTVLTCMRLYGFNRPATSKHVDEAAAHADTDEDEFKAMYHATYRASTFALRKYLKTVGAEALSPPLLEKKKAMGCIDEFLRLFCEDV